MLNIALPKILHANGEELRLKLGWVIHDTYGPTRKECWTVEYIDKEGIDCWRIENENFVEAIILMGKQIEKYL